MSYICWYFQLHQPWRLRPYSVFDVTNAHDYFDVPGAYDFSNGRVLRKVADKSYRPMLQLLLELLERHPQFCFTLSFSGVFLEQLDEFAPDVLAIIKKLVQTGRVEILGETYYHSLASLFDESEFSAQVKAHSTAVKQRFGVQPQVFRNTELIFSNHIAHLVKKLGFSGILAEGADHILQGRSPTRAYHVMGALDFPVFLKHYRLSDDVAFRFSQRDWAAWPLHSETYAHWLTSPFGDQEVVGLFMDFETFGEHQWESTGIFPFFESVIAQIEEMPTVSHVTPSELVGMRTNGTLHQPAEPFDAHLPVSWADVDRDLTAWLGNELQQDAIRSLYALGEIVKQSGNAQLMADWRRLQTSDHFYYMCTKWAADGDVHAYFSPYQSPYDAYVMFNNVLADMRWRLDQGMA